MSFDLGVLSGAKRLDPDQARDAYERLAQGAKWSSVLSADDRVAKFVAALSARWPDLDSLPESEVDDSPWSGGFEVSPAHVLLTTRFSATDDVVEFCLTTALGLGLNVFDPQDATLYSPGKEPRKATPRKQKSLICEHCGKVIEPGTPHAESPRVLHLECLMQTFP
jgi:hypothetical protein